ncbi:MAG: DUF262 domain-containing protein [Dysgonomonas mossii]|nr:DUF262 domain-containing protein [Dysgonomonas mossii]
MNKIFTLQEIADWQLNSEQSKVELPSIQRGFVWKPKQIEDLWDSLLRGYPIGSFLFSRTGEKLYLMDGQQRATSIFLGYFNPFKTNHSTKAWTIKGELPVIWIDILPDAKPNSSQYLTRIITRSHPWGYQANNNDTRLSISNRNKALSLFRQHSDNKGGYTSFKNSTVFPFDACYPLPLSFLLESKNIDEVIIQAEKYLPEYFSTKEGHFENKASFINLLKSDLYEELSKIFDTIKKIDEFEITSNIIEDRVLNEETEMEEPTLFVRINSAGTALTGDDLIYSIYKAIFPAAKNLIENIGLSFISPPQVLSLVSRIVASDLEGNSFVKKMNVRDFQRRIKLDNFKDSLNQLIETNEMEKLFTQAITILSGRDNSLFAGEIPPVIIKQLIKKNQELFLFFIYWLHLHNSKTLSEQTQLKIIAKLFSFAWFNFENIPRLWKEKIANISFWEEPLNELIWWNGKDGIHFLIEPKLLQEYYSQPQVENMFIKNDEHRWGLCRDGVGERIIQYFNKVKFTEDISLEVANEYFWKFIDKIQHTRQLILFAQRDYINSSFRDFNQMDDIEDSNAPWDWDHIYPSEWVYRKVYCNRGIRDWNNTNGNFRAISLEHNRSRSNQQSPQNISNLTEREYSFIQNNDWQHWKNIDARIWDDNVQNHFRAITTRMINIYEKFWADLKINDLIIY